MRMDVEDWDRRRRVDGRLQFRFGQLERGLRHRQRPPVCSAHGSKSPPGWTFWEIVPTGMRKEAFAAEPSGVVPGPPCGDIGYAIDYIGFFMIPDSHPGRVLYVNLGQDRTMIDPFSVTLF